MTKKDQLDGGVGMADKDFLFEVFSNQGFVEKDTLRPKTSNRQCPHDVCRNDQNEPEADS